MDHAYETLIINQLPYLKRTEFSEETMSLIGGQQSQQEVIIVPGVTNRVKTPVEKKIDARTRAYYMEASPQPMASAPVLYSQTRPPASGSPMSPHTNVSSRRTRRMIHRVAHHVKTHPQGHHVTITVTIRRTQTHHPSPITESGEPVSAATGRIVH